ncbi:hypothetical protein DFH08DRAFT_975488 [Mycena albidolilacea]|uniref:Uncharacterized protein n=1 Tax=Mycena albidolilacea TaxID=1033008 RepID=A0AAD6Z5P2_9AGAR|nr:hypothetical protein DFH08DRAFT_975488 [Mycena albidolilacea]
MPVHPAFAVIRFFASLLPFFTSSWTLDWLSSFPVLATPLLEPGLGHHLLVSADWNLGYALSAVHSIMPKSKKKICHCKPTCGKRLAKSTRRKHYRRTEASGQLPSESESTTDFSESRSFTPDDTIAHPDPLLLNDSMDIDYSHGPAMQQESPEPDDTMDLDSSASTSSDSESAPPNSDLSDASDDS